MSSDSLSPQVGARLRFDLEANAGRDVRDGEREARFLTRSGVNGLAVGDVVRIIPTSTTPTATFCDQQRFAAC
jgi:hypothetical protein